MHAKAFCCAESGVYSSPRATAEHNNNTAVSCDWCQCAAASVSRIQRRYAGFPPPSFPHCSVGRRGPLTCARPRSGSNSAGSLKIWQSPAGCLTSAPRFTSWSLPVPCFCGQRRLDWCFFELFVHRRWCGIILALPAVPSVSKFIFARRCWLPHTKTLQLPQFSANICRACVRCILFSFLCMAAHGSRCWEHQTIPSGLGLSLHGN